MSETIRLHEAWPLLVVICQLGSVGYALLTHRLRKHRRYGWFWRANDWALVVVGSALVAGSAAYALGSWLVFWVLVATYVVWGWSQIALALHHARNLMALVAAVGQMYGGNAYHRHMQAEAALIERYIREGQCELAALEQYPYTHREVAQHGGNEQRT